MELKRAPENAELRFAVLSDAHITRRGQGIERLAKAVMGLYRLGHCPMRWCRGRYCLSD